MFDTGPVRPNKLTPDTAVVRALGVESRGIGRLISSLDKDGFSSMSEEIGPEEEGAAGQHDGAKTSC